MREVVRSLPVQVSYMHLVVSAMNCLLVHRQWKSLEMQPLEFALEVHVTAQATENWRQMTVQKHNNEPELTRVVLTSDERGRGSRHSTQECNGNGREAHYIERKRGRGLLCTLKRRG